MRLWQKWLGRKVVGSNPGKQSWVLKYRALGKNQANRSSSKNIFVLLSWNQFSIFKIEQRFPWHLNRHQASWQLKSPAEPWSLWANELHGWVLQRSNMTGCGQVTWRHLHPIRFLRAGTSGEINQVNDIELEPPWNMRARSKLFGCEARPKLKLALETMGCLITG